VLDTHWEDHQPGYRVDFWTFKLGGSGEINPNVTPYSSEFQVDDARDVHEVVAWAEDNVRAWLTKHPDRPRTYVVYVIHERVDLGKGLIRVVGQDPLRSH
jgi:hypothetical protein